MLLLSHTLGETDGPGQCNAARVVELCAQDWGLYTTVTDNLAKVVALAGTLVPERDSQSIAVETLRSLARTLEEAPKSRGWRRRARLGRRVRWYETPDEV